MPKFGLAIKVKLRLCLAVFWGSEAMLWVLLILTLVLGSSQLAAWVLRLETMSMTCFWSTLVALSGWSSAAQNYKFGIVQIDLCHTDWYCQRQSLLSYMTKLA